MAQICENCGTKNRRKDNFCKNCGAPLGRENSETEHPNGDRNTDQARTVSSSNLSEDRPEKRGNKSTWIILIVGVLFLLAVAGGSYWFFFMRNEPSSEITIIQMPKYSVKSGNYSEAQKVELSSGTPDTVIYYTTDGSTPTTESKEYTSPITVDKDMTIKSIAVDSKGKASSIATATYTIGEEPDEKATSASDSNETSSGSIEMLTAQVSPGSFPFPSMANFSATASSFHEVDNGITYYASNVLDGNTTTAWVENVAGLGEGQSITLTYTGSDPFTINQIDFINGYAKSDTVFNNNSTPTQVAVSVNGSEIAQISLQVTSQPQVANLTNPVTLNKNDTVTFTLNQVSLGPTDDLNDTAITEIAFN